MASIINRTQHAHFTDVPKWPSVVDYPAGFCYVILCAISNSVTSTQKMPMTAPSCLAQLMTIGIAGHAAVDCGEGSANMLFGQSDFCLKLVRKNATSEELATQATGSCYRSLLVLSGVQCDANGKTGTALVQVALRLVLPIPVVFLKIACVLIGSV